MKHLSIKLRITLWYTMLMLLILLLVLGVLVTISETIIQDTAENVLVSVVDFNAEEVDYEDGVIEIDDDDFDYFKDGVTSLVYTSDFVLASGEPPRGFQQVPTFLDEQIQRVTASGEQYLVYDHRVTFKKDPELWVRGILPMSAISGVSQSISRLALFTLPFLVVLAAVGGYGITKRAFQPVRILGETVASITEGKDLSRRVEMEPGRDEIHTLAQTFNDMLCRLEQSFEAEKQFVSDVSHELRTPVSVILAQCEFALSQQPSGEAGEALQVIERQADRMNRLIVHLMTITRLGQANFRAELEEVDLSECTLALCEDHALLIPAGMELVCDIPSGLRARVDLPLYTRLLQNLLQNAFKYAQNRVEVSLGAKGGMVSLRVGDDGIGIPPEEQDRVWWRFYQANPSRTAEESGSMGLGLPIVRQIALLHHGEVTLESAPGQGSVFTFTFPQG